MRSVLTVSIRLRVLFVVLSLGLASCTITDDELGQESREVVNGVPVIGYPNAGSLQRAIDPRLPALVCSGTLIGCDTFLTAAHCVCDDLNGDPCGLPTPAAELSVFFQHAGSYQVTSVAAHPDFSFPHNDIAVLRLAQPVIGIEPAPLQLENPDIAAQMTIVGFGNTHKGGLDDGIKREGVLQRTACESYDDSLMLCFDGEDSPSVSCNGDSGGPNYLLEGGVQHVAGIVSGGGSDESCSVRQKFATQVAAFLPFIRENAGELGQERCGDIANVGDLRTKITVSDGNATWVYHEVVVPPGTAELRIGANSLRGDHLRLGLAREREPDYIVDDCGGEGRMTNFCSVLSPKPGTYQVVVSADTYHQVAMTSLAGAPLARADLYEAISGRKRKVGIESGLLINDRAQRGHALQAFATEAPQHGTVEIAEDGSFVYQSEPDFIGGDSFGYRVLEAPYSSETRVLIDVRAENLGDCGCSSSSPRSASGLALCLLAILTSLRRKQARTVRSS